MAPLTDPLQDPGARKYPVTRAFGDTSITRVSEFTNIGPHTGIDRAPPNGYPVVAAAAGVVRRAGWTVTGGGREVDIVHSDRLETRYMHLSAVTVPRDTMVRAGQVIGAVGSTGAALGPHLHFEVLVDGRPVDPAPYLGLAGAQVAVAAGPGSADVRPYEGSCQIGYVPARLEVRSGPLGFMPGLVVAEIGARGQVGKWDACLLAGRYQVGDAVVGPAAALEQAAGAALGEAARAVIMIGANLAVVVTGLVLVVGGAREALRS